MLGITDSSIQSSQLPWLPTVACQDSNLLSVRSRCSTQAMQCLINHPGLFYAHQVTEQGSKQGKQRLAEADRLRKMTSAARLTFSGMKKETL